jgi:hypothetical protein
LRKRPAKEDSINLSRMMALAMGAPRPATWPSHSFAHFINTDLDSTYSSFSFFRGSNPTDPFVAGQWSKLFPKVIRQNIGYDCLLKIIWELVHYASKASPQNKL